MIKIKYESALGTLFSKFPLGEVLLTSGFRDLYDGDTENAKLAAWSFISRHADGDWGDIPDEDRKMNENSMAGHGMILSRYDALGETLFVITRSRFLDTTIMLATEY